MAKSVCRTVYIRLYITFVSHTLTVKDIEICFVPYDRGTFLVSGDEILQYWKKVSIFLHACVCRPTTAHPPSETPSYAHVVLSDGQSLNVNQQTTLDSSITLQQSNYLFNFTADGTALLNASRVLVKIKHGRVVVAIADLDAERAEAGQRRAAVVLRLHRHAEVRDADLCFAVEHVCRLDDAGDGVDLKPVDARVSRLHQ